jgi:hypothetical protein
MIVIVMNDETHFPMVVWKFFYRDPADMKGADHKKGETRKDAPEESGGPDGLPGPAEQFSDFLG